MGFFLYSRETSDGWTRFTKPVGTKLFGKNFIYKALARRVQSGQNEPYQWHLNVRRVFEEDGRADISFVIDLKPRNKSKVLNFFELLDVWGYSAWGWSPVLFRQRKLLDAKDTGKIRDDFRIDDSVNPESVYSFSYCRGSISNGKLVEKWNCPPPSPTNFALLWPDHLRYFSRCIRQSSPEIKLCEE